MHTVAASFFKISREIRIQERCGHVHCISHIVPNRLISILSTFEEKGFPRKFRNFVNYRLACFAKNGEKFFFTIRTFFDCYTFKLINHSILESFTPNCPVVAE
ncbi:hypothetical protein T11_5555 [Trichinella zimbabwensis]|uniref:Uncharacterized protein n=1 Tax=Trichinella zimbabwensis TaxID=268475 RepID=A0A0V1GEZ4_9BILA|nr:hypothetical protein T11_5555 [Trichinella zimbabwensis]